MASFRQWGQRILGGVLTLFLLAFAGLATNGRMTGDFEVAPLNLDEDTRVAVLLFHGRDGGDNPIWDKVALQFSNALAGEPGLAVVNYNWSAGSDEPRRAKQNAAIYGEALADELAELKELSHVRLVAHSAAAYVLNELCLSYRGKVTRAPHIEMTFLDPFGNFDVGNLAGSTRAYGSCADYAAAYINTDDRVPTTNVFLSDAYNFDVTKSALRGEFVVEGHDWPVQYFLNVLDRDLARPGGRDHNRFPRGAILGAE